MNGWQLDYKFDCWLYKLKNDQSEDCVKHSVVLANDSKNLPITRGERWADDMQNTSAVKRD